jgi:putative oxidoreductase
MTWLLSSEPLSEKGIAIVRVVVGVLLIIHGTQVFYTNEMNDYGPWLTDLGVPFPLMSAYAGKIVELMGGLCLVTGMFLRIACVMLMATFLFISIVMGDGKILTDAQHPFIFFLFSMLFLFCGDSGYSIRKFLK